MAVGTNLGIQFDGAIAIGTESFGLFRIHPRLETGLRGRLPTSGGQSSSLHSRCPRSPNHDCPPSGL